jgi:hypothetical protein
MVKEIKKKTIIMKRVFPILISLVILFGGWTSPVFGYVDGTLIRADGYQKVYVLENGLRRWVTNINVFNGLGYKWSNVLVISKDGVDKYALGNDLTSSYSHPDGTLIRGEGPEVYLIEAGKKRWIPNPEIFNSKGFQWQRIITVNKWTLNSIKQGDNVTLEQEKPWPTTFIQEGPCKQFQSEIPTVNSTEVTFRFSGTNPTGPNSDLDFETYIPEYDQRWQYSYSDERTIKLEPGSKTYTFYVRAKNRDDYYDQTPAFCSFKTKISSYKDKISIYSVSGWSNNPDYEYITIGASYNLEQAINVTDWEIKTSKTRIIIPQAVEMLHPESIYNYKKDIYLNRSDRIIIYAGQSPIEEKAFAKNKCWQYIDDEQEYKDCFYNHNQDSDFLSGEWHIYLGRSTEMLDNTDESIVLYDENNEIIDSYEY